MPLWKDWGPTFQEDWCGFFNAPREVGLMEDGTLQFRPIKEIESLRKDPLKKERFIVAKKECELVAGDGVCFELKFVIDLLKTDAERLELKLRAGLGKETVCIIDLKKAEMTVKRDNADGWSRGTSRSIMNLKEKAKLDIHILSDQSSLEIFTNQYQNNHSNNVFAGDDQNKLFIKAYGGNAVIKEHESYGLEECFK